MYWYWSSFHITLLNRAGCSLIFLLILAETASPQQRSFAVYGHEDGLLTPQIFDLKSDSDGFLWIANGEGINIYDGTRFQSLTPEQGELSDAPAWRLIEARPAEMWVGTNKGIDVFRKRRKYKTIPMGSVNSFLLSYEGDILTSITSVQPKIVAIKNFVAREIFSWNSALILVDKIRNLTSLTTILKSRFDHFQSGILF